MVLLTKSDYLLGLQCPKFLWIKKNDKERIPEPTELEQKKFDVGTRVGKLATEWYSNGISLADEDFKDNLEKTKDAIKKKVPVFEAGFISDNLYSRADILNPVGDEWDIIEVKSGTEVKDLNIHDVAFQKYVYEKNGIKIRKCFLMHINKEYVKSGKLDIRKLFVQIDITEKVEEYSKDLEENIEKMFEIIKCAEPEFCVEDLLTIEYDNLCKDDFMDSLPEDNIFEFYRMLKKKTVELYNEGCRTMKDVQGNVKLNEKQALQRKLACEGGIHINKPGIKNFLGKLEYPIYYLDFETINPVLPKFGGMKPYQRIPFQFSLHVQKEKGGKLKHISFLAEGMTDPREKFMQALRDNLGETGSILVYNQGFEKGVMNECATAFPEFRAWYDDLIQPRIRDLLDVFRNFDYYDPKQKGSCSIKAVLPVMSDLSYSDLKDVKKGDEASYQWERVTFEDVPEEERQKIYDALEEYCKLDTLAEVKILDKLWEVVE
jgi:hypothetical protein